MPTPFRLDGIERVDETSAHIALREALVNLCVHTSYAEQGNMVIIRKPNSIVFRNPGRMLVSPEDFYAGSHSECRNPVLQKMFMLLGYGEKAGSGADFIMQGWADNNWPRPQIQEKVQPDCVELTFDIDQLVKSMSADLGIHTKENSTQTDTQTSTQTENYGTQKSEQKAFGEQKNEQKSEQNGISEQNGEQNDHSEQKNEQKNEESVQKTDRVYALIKNNPNVKRAEIAKALGISESAVQRLIKKLRDKNRIVRIGGDKGGHWQCND